ncbi:MAG: hypothetical protein ACREMN_07340, partial [Gemmatimonadales bacterium]
MTPLLRWVVAAVVTAVLLLVAGQPRATRLLLLDLAQSDPALLEQTAGPWRAVGYRVEYRRFYPHLTRQDLDRYRVVIMLAGGEPEQLSAALTLGDLAILTELTGRGGVVVLGYEAAGGALDRWTMNRWLAARGTGITIGVRPLTDTIRTVLRSDARVLPLPQSALDNAGFAAFGAGRNHPLVVARAEQVLARASGTAFVRARDGRPA